MPECLYIKCYWHVCLQDEDSEAILAADFEIGHFIRERIVPRAVLYFTGEAIEDDDDDVSIGVMDTSRHGRSFRH